MGAVRKTVRKKTVASQHKAYITRMLLLLHLYV